jgi:hypothetical protein
LHPWSQTQTHAPYFAGIGEAEQHILGRETFVRETTEELKNDSASIDDYNKIIRSICVMYVDGVSGIMKICVERDEKNRGTSTLPRVLPKSLLSLSKQQFGDLIVLQKIRLMSFMPGSY